MKKRTCKVVINGMKAAEYAHAEDAFDMAADYFENVDNEAIVKVYSPFDHRAYRATIDGTFERL